MRRRDIVIGLVILVLLVGVIYVRQRTKSEGEIKVPETLSSEQIFEEKFNIQIPDDVDKADLKNVDDFDGSGIATRKFENGKFNQGILADLPDLQEGYFYEGWLIRSEEGKDDYSLISTGKLRLAKGGWMLDFTSSTDFSDHSKVIVSLEKNFDRNLEERVIEGNF